MTCSTCIHHVRDWRLCHTPAKDVPEADFGNIGAHPILSPIPAGATPGEQAP